MKRILLLLLMSLTLIGGGWGYIDTTGNWVIEPQFEYVEILY
ncbi:MAG: WG repeat-containing protein [candidate division WOR-3 bacterium]